jgi:hypothetical protein
MVLEMEPRTSRMLGYIPILFPAFRLSHSVGGDTQRSYQRTLRVTPNLNPFVWILLTCYKTAFQCLAVLVGLGNSERDNMSLLHAHECLFCLFACF